MTNKERFLELCSKVKREGIEDLVKWLEASDFFYAPASTRFHGSYAGGLLEHSLNVYDELVRLLTAYPEVQSSEETAIIITLFHDLCKVNMYGVEKRNRKDANGRWESYDAYTSDEKFHYGGHGSKSVYLIQKFMPLTEEEAVSINCHMGVENGNYAINDAFRAYPLAFLLHTADMGSTINFNKEI